MTEEKGEQLLQKINTETNGALTRFLVESNLCPLCIEKGVISRLRDFDGENVCVKCGFTINSLSMPNTIPFGTVQKPENQLALGRGLGNTLGRKGLFCVLAHATNVKDLPIRAKQISIITQKFDPPKLTTMLRLGRNRCHEWGFDDHRNQKNIVFSNYLGRMLRKIGADIIPTRTQTCLSKLVDACFVLTLRATRTGSYEDAMDKLGVNPDFLNRIGKRYEELKMVYA